MKTQGWQMAMAIGLGVMGAIAAFPRSTVAQVVADPSIGTVVTPNGITFQITNGTTVGGNLFHSFSRFDVPTGGVASFLNNPNIVNIFSRVTGGTASQIDGIVRSTGTANLFLMNPSGIIFGQNARLDVGGSFAATTANAIQFGDRGFFSASTPEVPSSLLTINPSAFLFNQIPTGQIINNSNAPTGSTSPLGSPVSGLRVADGQSLLLVGGDIGMDGGRLNALGGRIELGGIAGVGAIGLDTTDNTFRLNFASGSSLSNITLVNDARVSVRGAGGGDIIVNANSFTATNGGRLVAGVDGIGNGGDITVNANEFNISGIGASGFAAGIAVQVITNAVGNSGNIFVDAQSFKASSGANLINDVLVQANGNSGNITVKADSLLLSNGAQIASRTYGQGNTGKVTIQSGGTVLLENYSFILSNIQAGGIGNAGDIDITANSIALQGVSQIQSILGDAEPNNNLPGGRGQAGNVKIRANNSVTISGRDASNQFSSAIFTSARSGTQGDSGNINISTGLMVLAEDGAIYSNTFGSGKGGNVLIQADNLVFRSGGQISGGSGRENVPGFFGRGGDITVNAKDSIDVDGNGGIINRSGIFTETSSPSYAGNLTVTTKRLTIKNGGAISSGASGSGSLGGNGGNLTVNASESIELIGRTRRRNGSLGRASVLTTEANGLGNAGKLIINTGRLSIRDGAIISAIVTDGNFNDDNIFIPTVGTGGDIDITANSLDLSNGGQIQANTYGIGNAGSIKIQVSGSISLDAVNGSDVGIFSGVAVGAKGRGGDITIKAQSLSLNGQTNRADINTATAGEGDAGNLSIIVDGSIDLSRGYISSDVDAGGAGKAGNVQIRSQSLTLMNSGQISSSVSPESSDQPAGRGQGGIIDIDTSDFVLISGTSPTGFSSGIFGNTRTGASGVGGDIIIKTSTLRIADGGVITTQTQNTSDAGNVTIRANVFEALSGGQVLSTTYNAGNAGSITVVANTMTISGSDSNFTSRFAQFGENVVANIAPESGVFANTTSTSTGSGGSLSLTTTNLNLSDRGSISAQSEGTGRAGSILINARGTLSANDGNVTTSAQSSGGEINIFAKAIRLRGDSDIRTNVASGDGGNIRLKADSIIALDDSDILAFAQEGKGGNITLDTRAFFGQNYRPAPPGTDPLTLDGNNRVDINASGTVSGIITLPDVSFLQNSLTEFPQTFTDTTQLLANSCIVRSAKQNGRFVITGSGGLPQRPGDAPLSSFPTGEVRGEEGREKREEGREKKEEGRRKREEGREETYVIQNSAPGTQQVPDRPWKIGDPIVEPQGVYKLANGDLVMSRECSSQPVSQP